MTFLEIFIGDVFVSFCDVFRDVFRDNLMTFPSKVFRENLMTFPSNVFRKNLRTFSIDVFRNNLMTFSSDVFLDVFRDVFRDAHNRKFWMSLSRFKTESVVLILSKQSTRNPGNNRTKLFFS